MCHHLLELTRNDSKEYNRDVAAWKSNNSQSDAIVDISDAGKVLHYVDEMPERDEPGCHVGEVKRREVDKIPTKYEPGCRVGEVERREVDNIPTKHEPGCRVGEIKRREVDNIPTKHEPGCRAGEVKRREVDNMCVILLLIGFNPQSCLLLLVSLLVPLHIFLLGLHSPYICNCHVVLSFLMFSSLFLRCP